MNARTKKALLEIIARSGRSDWRVLAALIAIRALLETRGGRITMKRAHDMAIKILSEAAALLERQARELSDESPARARNAAATAAAARAAIKELEQK